VVIVTGSMLFFLLQFPLANLGLCVLFARTAPTRKPLVAQLAAEVVALRQPSAHHPGCTGSSRARPGCGRASSSSPRWAWPC
jgi:hypothetical protein